METLRLIWSTIDPLRHQQWGQYKGDKSHQMFMEPHSLYDLQVYEAAKTAPPPMSVDVGKI